MTLAKLDFDKHMIQCIEALKIYEYLEKNGYSADFGLRFVWVAATSALDHYITQLIIEKATEHFANETQLSSRILNQGVPLSAIIAIQSAHPAEAVLEFRKIISQIVRYKTFQKADDISDGLSFVWNKEHKWEEIAKYFSISSKNAKRKLNSIAHRRDLIVHNADFDETTGSARQCAISDAQEVADYIAKLVRVIDELIP